MSIPLWILAAVLPHLALSQDWPGWRGPNRDGLAPAALAPAAWPEKLRAGWRLTVGEGHSSPVLAAGKLFVFSREGDDEVIRALDPTSGKVLWRQAYPAPYTMNSAAVSHGKGPKSTPLYAEGKLFTFGISGILTAWDANSGKRLWQKEFGRDHRNTSPLYGVAMSPLAAGGALIAHVGGEGGGALTAFDPATGAPRWRWTGDGPAYASPIVIEAAGQTALVTQTESKVVALSPADGRLLWQVPFTTAWVQNSVTPVSLGRGGVVYSGLSNGITAVRLTPAASGWKAEPLWRNTDASFYMNTPVLAGDTLYGFSHRNRGEFVALDVASGKLLWKSPPRQGENAAMLAAADVLLALTNEARLIVAKASRSGWEVIRDYTVAPSPTWAHPLLLQDGIVIKDRDAVAFWAYR